MDSLRYWVDDMHVDGFRFDLATVLARKSDEVDTASGFCEAVLQDPVLSRVKLIAEPWDIGPDGYHVGNFPAGWSEWNDRFRDTMRAFWRGDGPLLGTFAERFAGSSDLFRHHGRKPTATVNFVASHDGFTLADTVSYNERHNEANLENGADGHTHNLSWNHGVEGATEDPAIVALRRRQTRNFLATLMLAQGVPMLLAGDEFLRTQQGNNNAYCQDNDTSWFNWNLLSKRADVLRFVKLLIERRVIRDVDHERRRLSLSQVLREQKHAWHGAKLNQPDWSPLSHSVAISGALKPEGVLVHFILNAYWEPLDFELPLLNDGTENWRRWIDTALDPPHEICEWNAEQAVSGSTYRVCARSVVVLIADNGRTPDTSTGVQP
jgi:glycogen operon protein